MLKNINEIIKEITAWKKENPDAFFHTVKTVPRNLQYVISAVTDFGEKLFYIHIGSISKSRVSAAQHKIILRLIDAQAELRAAEQEFIKLFTSELN
jgi:hypothetical protein